MTTQLYNQEPLALYELFEPFVTALGDMRDKATSLIIEKKDESKVYGQLRSAEVLLDHLLSLASDTDPSAVPSMPIELETALRVKEYQLRQDMLDTSGYADMPHRIRLIMDRLNQKMEKFLSIMNQHYTATEEQLNWYRSLIDETFESKVEKVEISPNGWASLQEHLDSDEPNHKFEAFAKSVSENKTFEIINRI